MNILNMIVEHITILRLHDNSIQVIRLLQDTSFRTLNLNMVKYGKMEKLHPFFLIDYTNQSNLFGTGYTNNPYKAANYILNSTTDAHILFNFTQNESSPHQLPVAALKQTEIIPIEYLKNHQVMTLSDYDEFSEFHFKLSTYNLYLHLVINDQVSVIGFPIESKPIFIKRSEIIDILKTLDLEFAENFNSLVEDSQKAFIEDINDISSKKEKALILNELTNTILTDKKAIDKDLSNHSLKSYTIMKKK